MHFFTFSPFLEVGKIFSPPPSLLLLLSDGSRYQDLPLFWNFFLLLFHRIKSPSSSSFEFPPIAKLLSGGGDPPFVSLLPSSIKSVDAVPGFYSACLSKLFDMRPFPMIMVKHRQYGNKKLWRRMQKEKGSFWWYGHILYREGGKLPPDPRPEKASSSSSSSDTHKPFPTPIYGAASFPFLPFFGNGPTHTHTEGPTDTTKE